MVEKGMKCVKILLFIFNLMFFLFGLALLGVGIYVQVQLNQYYQFFPSSVSAPAVLIIAVGALTLIVGFFGCCGAIKEHYCMTMTFAVLIGIILICEIGGGIAGYVLRSDLHQFIDDGLTGAIENYNKSGHEGVTNSWDIMQEKLMCCGVNNGTDYDHISSTSTTPKSCGTHTNTGCLKALEDFVTNNVLYVAGVAVALGVVELIGIVFACCLGRAIKKEHTYA